MISLAHTLLLFVGFIFLSTHFIQPIFETLLLVFAFDVKLYHKMILKNIVQKVWRKMRSNGIVVFFPTHIGNQNNFAYAKLL